MAADARLAGARRARPQDVRPCGSAFALLRRRRLAVALAGLRELCHRFACGDETTEMRVLLTAGAFSLMSAVATAVHCQRRTAVATSRSKVLRRFYFGNKRPCAWRGTRFCHGDQSGP